MAYACEVVCDSISPAGDRLTTLVVTAHIDALYKISKCRSLVVSFLEDVKPTPLVTAMQAALEDPFVPAGLKGQARDGWWVARDKAHYAAYALSALGIDNVIAKRLLAPFLWETVVISGTDWDCVIRCAGMPSVTAMMIEAMRRSEPLVRKYEEWHVPELKKAYGVEAHWLTDAGHAAQATDRAVVSGPFKGWQQSQS
jgi:hypothetical protein